MRLGLGLGIKRGARGVDPWAAAALSRMASPPADFITRLDAGARILRAAGVLDLLDVLYLCGSYSQASARLNLCRSSFALTEVNSPTWTAWASGSSGGYTGGGTAYLDTGADPSTQFTKATLNSAAYGAWVSSETVSNGASIGSLSLLTVAPRSSSDAINSRVHITSSATATGITSSIGLTSGNRSGTAVTIYRNGSSVGSATTTATGMPTELWLLHAFPASYYPGQVSAAFAGASMTASQHLALYRGIAAMLGVPV